MLTEEQFKRVYKGISSTDKELSKFCGALLLVYVRQGELTGDHIDILLQGITKASTQESRDGIMLINEIEV